MRLAALVVAAAGACWLSAPSPAAAAVNASGEVIAGFDAALRPSVLPRSRPSPVAVRVDGRLRPAPGADGMPQLRRIVVALNRQGRLHDRGLPVCRPRRVESATESAARRLCGGALVGHGSVRVQAHLPTQPTFSVHARLLAFNGPRRHGHRLIVAHVYAKKPPGSFSLIFRVSHRPGLFGTVLTTDLPRGARGWAYLTRFQMTLRRTYVYRGARRSYVAAACEAPAGFRALFPFARATYSFADGQSLTMSEAATCRVAGE